MQLGGLVRLVRHWVIHLNRKLEEGKGSTHYVRYVHETTYRVKISTSHQRSNSRPRSSHSPFFCHTTTLMLHQKATPQVRIHSRCNKHVAALDRGVGKVHICYPQCTLKATPRPKLKRRQPCLFGPGNQIVSTTKWDHCFALPKCKSARSRERHRSFKHTKFNSAYQ